MFQNNSDIENADLRASASADKTDDRPRVLVAEDDDAMRKFLVRVLCADGYAAVECRDGIDVYESLGAFIVRKAALNVDVIISDIRMPGLTGLEILEDLHDLKGFPPMILITAFGDAGVHARAKKAGAVAVFDKPFAIDELLGKLHEIAPRGPSQRKPASGRPPS